MLDNKLVIVNKDLGNFKTELVGILINDTSIFKHQKLITIEPEVVTFSIKKYRNIEYYNILIKLINDKIFKLEFRSCINYRNEQLIASEFTDDLDAIKTAKLLQQISDLDKALSKEELFSNLILLSNNEFIELISTAVNSRLTTNQFNKLNIKQLISNLVDEL